jgi:hypothetical protein
MSSEIQNTALGDSCNISERKTILISGDFGNERNRLFRILTDST